MAVRVLVVSHGHPEVAPGGAELAAYQLFKGLQSRDNIEPWFLAWSGGSAFYRETTPFSCLEGRPNEIIFQTSNFDFFLFSQRQDIFEDLTAVLQKIRPDVIHLHHYSRVGLEFIALARRLRPETRIVTTLHEYLAICHHNGQMVKIDRRTLCYKSSVQDCPRCFPAIPPSEFMLRKSFIQAHFAKVDLFVSPSDFLRSRYVEWGTPPWRIARIDNAVDALQPLPPRPLLAGERRGVMAYFGQINPYKGLLDLLKAFELIAQAQDAATAGVRLVVYGANLEFNAPDFVEAVTKALARNGARVHFAGPYRREEIPRLMAGVDWVVVPSLWWENSPLVIEEALAHRRPVLCSNIGGMAEKVVPGRDGLHFEVGNPFEIAGTILRAACDVALWDHLYASMRRPLELDDWVARHLEIYDEDPIADAS